MMQTRDKWFDDYELGETRTTVGRTITETDIVVHAGQTGDFFPHHMDAAWAASQPIGQRIAHGTLVFSSAVGMTAGDINPRAMSYGYDRIRFVKPVFIGDTLTVATEIVDKRDHATKPDAFGYVHESVIASNQRSEVVLALVHLYLVDKRGTA